MISAGEIGPDATVLINGRGGIVLHVAGQFAEVDGSALSDALTRSRPAAELVARSATSIDDMPAPFERMLARFGCTRVRFGEESQP